MTESSESPSRPSEPTSRRLTDSEPAETSAVTPGTPLQAGQESGGGSIFSSTDAKEFVSREWERLWTNKASLEQRAITLITTSGVLVTLAFGFTTAITKSKSHSNFTTTERSFLVVALAFFAASAVVALLVNLPKGYNSPDFRDILSITVDPIELEPLERLEQAMTVARRLNNKKARMLADAFALQLIAIATLAVVVGIVTA